MRNPYKTLFLLIILSTSFLFCKAQDTLKKPDADTERVFTIVEEMPQFPGGEKEMFAFIQRNIRYPAQAFSNNISGKVYLVFVVDTDGTVVNPEILRGIGGGCDEEAIRVINLMPKWIPGKQNGKHVRVKYNLPISFKILEQLSNDSINGEPIFLTVEEMPQFPGGFDLLYQFLYHNLKYPSEAREKNIIGKVYVRFIVEKNGDVVEPKIIEGIGGGCDEEALRILRLMPKWNPGTQNGKPVNAYFNLPINFTLK